MHSGHESAATQSGAEKEKVTVKAMEVDTVSPAATCFRGALARLLVSELRHTTFSMIYLALFALVSSTNLPPGLRELLFWSTI